MTPVSIEDVIERIRALAGAEFAFVLTMRGRLVTDRAPREMPEAGRTRLVNAARAIMDSRKVDRLTLPRDALVPYGGPAPIDIFFAVAAERAIVCVVVMSGPDQSRRVSSAIEAGLDEIEAKFQSAFDSRVLSRGTAELPPSTRKEPSATGSVPPPGTEPPHSVSRAQGASPRSTATSRRRREPSAPTLKASPRALDRSSLGPHSVPVPPASVARFIATGEPSQETAFDRSWADHRVLEEIESDAREANEPISAPLPPTARRESFPPLVASSELSRSRKSTPPNVTVELADADDDLLEAVRLNEAHATGHGEKGQTESAPKKKEGGDSLPATQRVPEPRK